MDKELEKELKQMMKETLDYANTRMGMVEKSIIKYADKKLDK